MHYYYLYCTYLLYIRVARTRRESYIVWGALEFRSYDVGHLSVNTSKNKLCSHHEVLLNIPSFNTDLSKPKISTDHLFFPLFFFFFPTVFHAKAYKMDLIKFVFWRKFQSRHESLGHVTIAQTVFVAAWSYIPPWLLQV